jgi:hypothetical protein
VDPDQPIQFSSEKPRFLAPITKPRDYVDRPELAVHGEPECIGPAIVDGYAELANFQQTLRHKQSVEAARVARPLLAAEDRLKDAERRAKHAHHNLTGEFHVLRQMLARADRGGRKAPPAALVRLERIEATLDGVPLRNAA